MTYGCGLFVQVFLTPEYLAIAMEYAAGGDMFQLVVRQRGLPESDARWYFQQLIIAIDYCHRMVRHIATSRTKHRDSEAKQDAYKLSALIPWHGYAGCGKPRYQAGKHIVGQHNPPPHQDL